MAAAPQIHRLQPYAVAVLATLAAVACKSLLGPELVPSAFLTAYGAALFSAWYGGFGPGLLSIGLSIIGASFLYLPLTGVTFLRDALFAVVASTLVYVTATLGQRQQRAMSERTHALETALATLGESEERFRQAFECAPIGMALAGLDGRIHKVNGALCAMMGYPLDELWDRAIDPFLHPDDTDQSRAARALLLRGEGQAYQAERRFLHRAGHVVWAQVSVSLLCDRSGEPREFIAQLRDVTDRKRAEEELRDSEAKFRGVAETAAAAIFIYSGTTLCYVNPEAEAITGYASDELLAMSFWDVIHPSSRDLVRERGMARQRGEAIQPRYEVCIRRKDGTMRWVDFTGARIQYAGLPAVFGTAFDITERKRAEDAVREREAQLAHVLRLTTLGEMATSLAHEINQPLAAIVNYARGCGRRMDTEGIRTDGVREVIEQIATEALRAAEIIRRLRMLVRNEPPRRDVMDLNYLVRDAVRLMEREAREQKVRLVVDLVARPVEVCADEVQIEQVILNLLRNALEALGDGDHATRDVVLTVRADRGVAELSVRDTGKGLPDDDGERLFEPFFTTKSGGLGMGLTISRSIVEAHGGQLWASPHPECGALLRLTLPFSVVVSDYVH